MAMRCPGEMAPQRVAMMDFDGTMFDTGEPSPSGMNVEKASNLAVREVTPELWPLYVRQGGLRNRSAIGLFRDLAPDATPAQQDELRQRYDEVKFGHTMSEVGTRFSNGDTWPRPVPGFMDFYDWQKKDPYINPIGITSSNEEGTGPILAMYDLELPILETKAMTRHAKQRGLDQVPVKPSPLPVEFAFEEIRKKLDIDLAIAEAALRLNTAMIGDGMAQDGEMARRAGIDFFWVWQHGEARQYTWRQFQYRLTDYIHPFQLASWRDPAELRWSAGDGTSLYQVSEDEIQLYASSAARV